MGKVEDALERIKKKSFDEMSFKGSFFSSNKFFKKIEKKMTLKRW